MAVNTFTFGSITSSTYGIYVSGEALFNAPKRSAEVVSIPGRDGAYILDKGSFENIEVTYRVFNQEKDLTDFRTKLANLRSALCSQVGYQRLTDTFHPDEYRMAAFVNGIDVVPVKYNTASEFNLVFNCKPQRYLTSGETVTSVANNGSLNNPTLFDSSPMLEFKGYGNIGFNGYNIAVENVPIGEISLISKNNDVYANNYNFTLDVSKVNNGDSATANVSFHNRIAVSVSGDSSAGTAPGSPQPTDSNNDFNSTYSGGDIKTSGKLQFNIGTNASATNTTSGTANCWASSKGDFTVSYSITETIQYNASTNKVSVSTTGTATTTKAGVTTGISFYKFYAISITAMSTVSAVTSTVYIDCDIGEVYSISNNEIVSLNNIANLGFELPKLASGNNTFTYDNTITSFKVKPRWWKV